MIVPMLEPNHTTTQFSSKDNGIDKVEKQIACMPYHIHCKSTADRGTSSLKLLSDITLQKCYYEQLELESLQGKAIPAQRDPLNPPFSVASRFDTLIDLNYLKKTEYNQSDILTTEPNQTNWRAESHTWRRE